MLSVNSNKVCCKEIPANSIDSSTANCLLAAHLFSEVLSAGRVSTIFEELNQKVDFGSLPRNISVQKQGKPGEIIASLSIDFIENRLVTSLQGQEKSIKLSSALGIIRDLSEIFANIKNIKTKNLLAIEDEFSTALNATGSSNKDFKLTLENKTAIALYPSKGRVALSTSRGQSSMPIDMIVNCAHLFNREFAQSISPLLGLDPSINGLVNGINKLYLGRCIAGLGKSIATRQYSQVVHEREFSRIASHIIMPGSALYSPPIL